MTTEKRLARNEKYASTYGEQMKEMEELKFSRKLTQGEMNSYKGAVHYISHHAVIRPEKKKHSSTNSVQFICHFSR